MWSVGQEFIREFQKLTLEHGGTDCRDIARMDWLNKDMAREFYNNLESRRKICIQVVGDSALMLGKLLEAKRLA